MTLKGSYYCSGCKVCSWENEGIEGTEPARQHHDETGHSTFSERTTLFTYGA